MRYILLLVLIIYTYFIHIYADPIRLIGTYSTNHETTSSIVSISPDSTQIFAIFAGSSLHLPFHENTEQSSIFSLTNDTLIVRSTIMFDTQYTICLGGAASRSFYKFAMVDYDTINIRLRIFDNSLRFPLITRIFYNSSPSDFWTSKSRPSFTDNDKYLSIGISNNYDSDTSLYILDTSTLENVYVLKYNKEGNTDGHFFSQCTGLHPSDDYFIVGKILNPLNASLLVYKFTNNNLILTDNISLPQIPLSITSIPYLIPNKQCNNIKISVTTGQADILYTVNIRRSNSIVPSFLS